MQAFVRRIFSEKNYLMPLVTNPRMELCTNVSHTAFNDICNEKLLRF